MPTPICALGGGAVTGNVVRLVVEVGFSGNVIISAAPVTVGSVPTSISAVTEGLVAALLLSSDVDACKFLIQASDGRIYLPAAYTLTLE